LESLSRSPQACIFLLDRLVHHRSRLLHSFRVLPSLSFILDGSQVSAMHSSIRFLQLPRIIPPHFAVFYLCITCSDLFLYILLVIAERCSGLSPPRIRRTRKFNFDTVNLVQRWW
jgi:hypothetical protein